MVKVLQYVPSFNTGGIESFVLNMNEELQKECEFTYLVERDIKESDKTKIKKLGGKIIRIPNLTKDGILKHIINIKKIIKSNKFDVVHVHQCDLRIFVLLFAKKYGVKTRILHVHTTKLERHPKIKKIFFSINMKLANKFLACSNEAAETMYGKKCKDAIIIRNGISIEKYEFSEKYRNEIRKELNIPKDDIVIGTVGRFVDVKNQSFLIDIYSEYKKINFNSKLLLIGNGPLLDDLKAKAKKLGIDKDVVFLIDRKDINEIYSAMDIFILPSKFEGLGIVAIEAQANGLQCIVSRNVPVEANITEKINYLDINEKPEYWAKFISQINFKRYNKKEIIIEKGYDRKSAALDLFNVYKGEKNENNK